MPSPLNRQDHTLTVSSNSKQLVLKFTDEPVEKQPPLQFKRPKPPQPGTLQQVGKIAWGILEVIAKPKPRGGRPQAAPGARRQNAPPSRPARSQEGVDGPARASSARSTGPGPRPSGRNENVRCAGARPTRTQSDTNSGQFALANLSLYRDWPAVRSPDVTRVRVRDSVLHGNAMSIPHYRTSSTRKPA